jgi:tetratricopeptide (TPR) repeat protein
VKDGDDEVLGDWSIDEELRRGLRMDAIHRAMEAGDWVEAEVEAEELLDEAPEHREALLLLGQAMLGEGDPGGALLAYERHLQLGEATAAALIGLAVARFETCDIAGAVEAAREAVRLDPSSGDAHHALGLALERLPRRSADSVNELMAAHRLEPERFPLPLHMDARGWRRALEEARGQLPAAIRAFWAPVPVEYTVLPDLERLRAVEPPLSPSIGGMYFGEPPEEADPATVRPARLDLFTGNLSRAASWSEVVDHIVDVMVDEALDWLDTTLEELEPS